MAPDAPARWPQDVRYIRSQQYHSSVSQPIRTHLCPTSSTLKTAGLKHISAPVTIKLITADGHPAKGQRGLFATRKIPPRSHIIDYVGEVHCDDRPHSDYDLSLCHHQGVGVGVDASRMGNEARFINDYRGVAAKPNALFEERRNSIGELCMAVWSGKDEIKKGQEILVSYGKGFWQARCGTSEES